MTTLPNRHRTALLIIDVQNNVIAGSPNRDAVVANIARLAERARSQAAPVIWVQHHDDGPLLKGGEGWRIVPELAQTPDEPVIEKAWGDAFEETKLEETLSKLGVGRLVVAGAQTDACIRSTLHGALVRGYDVVLVGDAHTTEDLTRYGAPTVEQVIAHTNLYWKYQTAPGRTAGTMSTSEIEFKS